MLCPVCSAQMAPLDLDARLGTKLAIDLCAGCKAIWFDRFEDLQMAPAATLKVFGIISAQSSAASAPLTGILRCPRCASRLLLTHDSQRNTPFRYWRCDAGHGRLMTFMDFLRQKDFIRPLSPQQLQELRQSVQTINCSNCGGTIDLARDSVCRHCGSALSMLDLQQMARTIAQLQAAAAGSQRESASAAATANAAPNVRALSDGDMEALIRALNARGRDEPSGLVETGLGMIASLLTWRL